MESKLPILISIDWSKIVAEEEIDYKTSKEKFESFMKFSKLAKQRIEYLTSGARCCGDVNFVTGVATAVAKHEELESAASELRKLRGAIYRIVPLS